MKHFFIACSLSTACLLIQLLFAPSAWAYPWLNSLLEEQTNKIELSATSFYYEKKSNKKFYFQLGSDFSFHNQKIDLDMGINYLFYEKKFYVRPAELAVFFPLFSQKWRMGLGIKKHLWSLTDSYWNHGFWQARYKLDNFRPQLIGLPGLYFEYKGEAISWIFLASYFHIPDISYSPRLKGNRLVSKNPFFNQSSADQFEWKLEKWNPFKIKTLFHPTLAFQIKHSLEKADASFSYAYKPTNRFQRFFLPQLSHQGQAKSDSGKINLDALLPIKKEPKDPGLLQKSITDFTLSLFQSHLVELSGQADIGKNFSLSVSFTYEKPEPKAKPGPDWETLTDGSKRITSLLAYFKESGEDYKTLLSFGWTQIHKPSSGNNKIMEDFEDAFGLGFMWKEALSAGAEHKQKNIFEEIDIDLAARVVYTLDNQFFSLITDSKLHFPFNLQFFLSGDLIFRLSRLAYNKSKTSSIHKYKDLDRISMGLKYVF